MIRACLRALLSHWWRNPLQLFALFAGLALATSLWTGVQAINSEARASYDAAAQTLGQGRYDLLVPQQGDTLPQQTYIDLRLSGWLVSPMIEGRLNGVRLVGFDVLTAPDGMGTSEMNTAPAPDTAAGALFANAEAARALEGKVDMRIDPSIGPGLAIGDIGTVQRLLNREDLSQLIVLPTQPLGRPDLADVAPDLRLQASNQAANVAELTDSFHLNLTAFGFLSFAVGLFIVQSTIGLQVADRSCRSVARHSCAPDILCQRIDYRLRFAGLPFDRRRPGFAGDLFTGIIFGRRAHPISIGTLVLRRHAPAIARPEPCTHGAPFGSFRKYRCHNNGIELPADLFWLSGSTTGPGTFHRGGNPHTKRRPTTFLVRKRH